MNARDKHKRYMKAAAQYIIDQYLSVEFPDMSFTVIWFGSINYSLDGLDVAQVDAIMSAYREHRNRLLK